MGVGGGSRQKDDRVGMRGFRWSYGITETSAHSKKQNWRNKKGRIVNAEVRDQGRRLINLRNSIGRKRRFEQRRQVVSQESTYEGRRCDRRKRCRTKICSAVKS